MATRRSHRCAGSTGISSDRGFMEIPITEVCCPPAIPKNPCLAAGHEGEKQEKEHKTFERRCLEIHGYFPDVDR